MGRFGRVLLFVLVCVVTSSGVAFAQAGATKKEKDAEKIERMGAKTPGWQIKPDAANKKAPVITFVTVPSSPYTGPILDFKNGPNGTKVPYDVRTGQYVSQDVRNTASWRRMPDGMIYDIGSGKVVPKAVVDASAAAYDAKKAGAPDPVGTERKLSFNTDSALPEAERKAREKELNKPKHHVEVWKTGATGKTGIDIDALGLKNGEVALVPENAYVDVKLKLGQAEGTAVAQANVGPDGADVNFQLEGKVTLIGVQAETGKLEVGDKDLGGSVYARTEIAILAEAKAQGHLQVGPDGLLVGGEAGAFAGAKAKLEIPVTVKVKGVEARATAVGEVSYGIGAEGKVYAKITWTSIKFRAQGHAALGVGVGGEVDIEVSVADLVKEMAPPEAPTLAAIAGTKNEVNPLADHWTLSKDEYKKLATAVLEEDVNRAKALGEVKARQDHWLSGLADHTATKRALTEGSDFTAPFVRLQHEIYRNNPDAVAGLEAAINEAKTSGVANDSRWGGGRLKTLQEIAARNARVKTPFDSSTDFLIPEVNRYFVHEGKSYTLPSHTGPEGMNTAQLLGIGDFWVSISDEKKKVINKALAGKRPEDQNELLKTLAADEISARVSSEMQTEGRPDTSWMVDIAGPAGEATRAAAEKKFTKKQLNILQMRYEAAGDRLLAGEISEMVYGNASGAQIADRLWMRLLPANTETGRRARNEIRLEQYPSSFPVYLRWLTGERVEQKNHRVGLGRTDTEKAYAVGLFADAMAGKDASVDRVLRAAGVQDGRYSNTTIQGEPGDTRSGNTKTAAGAGILRN